MPKIGPSILACRIYSLDLAPYFNIDYKAEVYEDTEIMYYVFGMNERAYISDKVIYNYIMHSDSLFFKTMTPLSSEGRQILYSSISRENLFRKEHIYDRYESPLKSLELTFFYKQLKKFLRVKKYKIKYYCLHI